MYKTITLTQQDAIWTLTIQRPEAMNALNSTVLEELSSALTALSQKPFSEAKCLILTGAGEKAFVAGADIKELNSLDTTGGMKFAQKGQSIFRQIENLKIPVIAAVNGFALGGGLELTLACDFIFASENAKFGLPEVTLGLIPGFGGTVRLSRVVGQNRAKEMIYTGEMVNALEAYRLGLVNRVLPLVDLLSQAQKTAATISLRGSVAVGQAKRAILKTFDQDLDTAMNTEAQEFSGLFSTFDFKEGTTAFVEKRKPAFQGK
ncbi:MAG: crotonase [Oligoflexia bacterium]|nr:MAG: crotonase [Oligoflexia bacterium]